MTRTVLTCFFGMSLTLVLGQKPNTNHCYKIKTEENVIDGIKTTTMGGMKYQLSFAQFLRQIDGVDTTFTMLASWNESWHNLDEGMIVLLDDGTRFEYPQAIHTASLTQQAIWDHVGMTPISQEDLRAFSQSGIKAFRIGNVDAEIKGSASKAIPMTIAYCILNAD